MSGLFVFDGQAFDGQKVVIFWPSKSACFELRKNLAAAEGWVEHEFGEETRCLDKPGLTRVSVVLPYLAETQRLTVPGLIWVSVAYELCLP